MKRIIALVVAALLVAGCSSKDKQSQSSSPVAGPQDIAITTAFTPDPPQKGTETLTVTLKDGTGAPVKGATVKIDTAMPSMSMSGPSVTAHDNGDGTYTAVATLAYATTWNFTIKASANGRSAALKISREVK